MADESVILALEQQVDCYRLLSRLADLQHVHVQQSQTEQLLEVLMRRQAVLEQIARLERLIGPAKKQWTEFLTDLDDPRRAQAEQLLAETRQLLEQITAADRDDCLVLQQRKVNLGRAIGQTSTGRQVNRNYATAAYGRPASNFNVRQ